VVWDVLLGSGMRSERGFSMLVACLLGFVCPACGLSPDVPAPQSGAEAAHSGDADAPNGVCRVGAQRVEHVGCVDEELSFSPDALDACRSDGAKQCDERCQSGDTPSCTALALVHQLALEASPNTTYAAHLYEKACAAGDGAACNDLGVMHGKGLGLPVDYDRAETLYAVACEKGNVEGCVNFATSRSWGSDPPENVAHAVLAVQDACVSAGQARACAALGKMRARGSAIERDEKLAASLFDRACTGGDVHACEELGRAYLQGDGVTPDDDQALRLFRKACDSARSDACSDLAMMYCMGRGVAKDPVRSTTLFRQACDAGEASACRAKACGVVAPL
jgi:TPR repeat protein